MSEDKMRKNVDSSRFGLFVILVVLVSIIVAAVLFVGQNQAPESDPKNSLAHEITAPTDARSNYSKPDGSQASHVQPNDISPDASSNDVQQNAESVTGTDSQAQGPAGSITLHFYDKNTNCSLNGKVSVDNIFLGVSDSGKLVLTRKDYDRLFTANTTLSIIGNTDSCFEKDANLPFFSAWTISSLEYYFENDVPVEFQADITPRFPNSYILYPMFIRPNETMNYVSKIVSKSETVQENIDNLGSKGINYQFKADNNYWQIPKEFMNSFYGNCHDWAVSILSMMKAYNSSLKCYDIIWSTHMNVICYYDSVYTIYDQSEVKSSVRIAESYTSQMKKEYLRNMIVSYSKKFGLNSNERYISGVFDDKNITIFDNTEDPNYTEFIDWLLSLEN